MPKPWFVAAIFWTVPALASATPRSVYVAPEVREDAKLYDLLLFSTAVDHASGSTIDWQSTNIVRDGSPIRLYFESKHTDPEYGFCYKFTFRDALHEVRTRSGCRQWRDRKQHSVEILSPPEAKRLSGLRLHTYDVRGVPSDWDGSGDPPDTLTHEVEDFTFTDATLVSRSIDLLKSAVTASAKAVLLCAHPTATYRGVAIDDVRIGAKAVVDFRIAYQCNGLLERPCSMSLQATFGERKFEGLKVTEDTALTDARVGLDLCGAILRDALDAMSRG
ncbi:hypothetical protein OV079_02100 [Nannocystis pusilla]|uniref:Lipoprotein n=1 Tax=Nannocystis pusilla TaxID=889268 RepID=A0A9X3ITU0_9BACT|nr:hypothetical protein [Nannocystis pusilla]MCY1004377.1 hypothetical protein [Nannocystis pusilla]